MVSVVIPVYRGSKHLSEQILSILPQLKNEDEIIISDDRPGGITERIVKKIAAEDSRVIWVEGKNKGSIANTANALRYCKGDRIFFASPRDVWLSDKVKRVNEAFDEGADMVLHNAYITDELLNITDYSLFEKIGAKRGVVRNIRKNSYYLSCLAIRRKMLKKIMPVPKTVPDMGQWTGLICEFYGKVKLVDLPLIYCRVNSAEKQKFEQSFVIGGRSMGILVSKLYKRVLSRH